MAAGKYLYCSYKYLLPGVRQLNYFSGCRLKDFDQYPIDTQYSKCVMRLFEYPRVRTFLINVNKYNY